MRTWLIWLTLLVILKAPVLVATGSPYLGYRSVVYVVAGFAGIVALSLLCLQPLLATNLLPDLRPSTSRRLHQWLGMALVSLVLVHVTGLWITSPPDVVDALLLQSPTPFSIWGVLAMWALFAAALLAAMRRKLKFAPRMWRLCHLGLVSVTVVGTVLHALLIEGAMELTTKIMICAAAVLAILWALSRQVSSSQ